MGTVATVDHENSRDRLGWSTAFETAWENLGRPGDPARVTRLDRGWSTAARTLDQALGAADPVRLRNIGADVAVADWILPSDDGDRVEQGRAVCIRGGLGLRPAGDEVHQEVVRCDRHGANGRPRELAARDGERVWRSPGDPQGPATACVGERRLFPGGDGNAFEPFTEVHVSVGVGV